jgi:hypothetical protein
MEGAKIMPRPSCFCCLASYGGSIRTAKMLTCSCRDSQQCFYCGHCSAHCPTLGCGPAQKEFEIKYSHTAKPLKIKTNSEIPRHQYPGQKFLYIRISEIPEELRPEFLAWMRGQTVPLVEGLEPQDAVYEWDFDRFLVKKKTGWELWD